MASVYFANAGDDSDPGTILLPKQVIDNYSQSANDVLYANGGDTFAGFTASQAITITSYGTGRATIANAADDALIVSASGVTLSNVILECTHATSFCCDLSPNVDTFTSSNVKYDAKTIAYGGFKISNPTTDISGFYFIGDEFTGANANNRGGLYANITSASVTVSDIVMDGCNIHSNANDGIRFFIDIPVVATSQFNSITIKNSRFDSNTLNALWIRDGEAYGTQPTGWSENINILNNTFTNNGVDNSSAAGCIHTKAWKNSVIRGNWIDGNISAGGAIQLPSGDNVLIEFNHVKDITPAQLAAAGEYIDGNGIMVDQWSTGITVRYNLISGCVGDTERENSGGAIVEYGAFNSSIYGNVAYDCKHLLHFGKNSTPITSGNLFYNNTGYNFSSSAIHQGSGAAFGSAQTGTMTIRNNIAHTATYGINTVDDFADQLNNCFYNCSTTYAAAQTTTTGNITDDPMFISLTNSDFRLSAGSPCIGMGTDTDVTDYYGRRFREGHYDMGAFRAEQGIVPAGIIKTTLEPVKLR